MKLCFPVESDKGLDSEVFGHFGSAPIFVVFDTEVKSIDTIKNLDLSHAHGMCSPLKALGGKMIDSIVVGGIGAGALNKLNGMGIEVYKALKVTVRDNIELFDNNTMPEITVEHACFRHAGGHGHKKRCQTKSST